MKKSTESLYDDCVEKLFKKYSTLAGVLIVQKLLEALGNVHQKLRIIHIGGTNGKGSVTTNIAKSLREYALLLHKDSFNIGMFVSPHIVAVQERISINGHFISKKEFVYYYTLVMDLQKKSLELSHVIQQASFFDLLTVMALLYFYYGPQDHCLQQLPYCPVVVLEVGMGGRLDATNIFEKSLCSILTSIGWDHVNVLGGSLESIAYEKSGIFKRECPVVLGSHATGFNSIESAIHRLKCFPVVRIDVPTRKESFGCENHRIVIEALKIIISSIFNEESHHLSRLKQFLANLVHVLPFCRYWILRESKVQQAVLSCHSLLVHTGYTSHPGSHVYVLYGFILYCPDKLPLICLDVGHNKTAIDRVCWQFKRDFPSRDLRVLCALSRNRSLDIFEPLLWHFTFQKEEQNRKMKKLQSCPKLIGLHYGEIKHPRVQSLKEIDYQLQILEKTSLDYPVMYKIRKAFKEGYNEIQSKMVLLTATLPTSSIAKNCFCPSDKNCFFKFLLYTILLQCCSESSNLLCIGTSFMMKDILECFDQLKGSYSEKAF